VLEQISRQQACRTFCGRYSAAGVNASSSLALSVDDGPGLLVGNWTSNGVDIHASAQAYADATGGGTVESIRLYPTGLHSQSGSAAPDTNTPSQVAYRALIKTVTGGGDPSATRIFDPDAKQWGYIDSLVYGGIAVDEFAFHLDEGGDAVAVEPRGLRQTLQRVSHEG
jgi:hypothetical protein